MKQSIIDDMLKIAGENIKEHPQACRMIAKIAVEWQEPPTGSKIEYVKWHRETFGTSLAEAKACADAKFDSQNQLDNDN